MMQVNRYVKTHNGLQQLPLHHHTTTGAFLWLNSIQTHILFF